MDFFLFKKFVGVFFMPLPVLIVLLLIGLYCIVTQRRKSAILFTATAIGLLFMVSLPSIPNSLLRTLEHQYPQYDRARKVDYIVVLGCNHVNDRSLPITSQIHPCSVIRDTEAVRIWRMNPQALIVTSGNAGREPYSNAYMNKQLLVALGVPSQQIHALEKAKDTEQEAKALAPLLKDKSFVIVTSASHLARAIPLFEAQGLSPIAAPTEHLVRLSDQSSLADFAPAASNIQKFERWWYEAMGRTWQWIRS